MAGWKKHFGNCRWNWMGKLRPVVGAESKSQSMTSAFSMINEMARCIGIRTVAPASQRITGTIEQGSAIRARKRSTAIVDVASLVMSGNPLQNLLWGLIIAGHVGISERGSKVRTLRAAKSNVSTCGNIAKPTIITTVFKVRCLKSMGPFARAVANRSASFLRSIMSIMTVLRNAVHTAGAGIDVGSHSSLSSPISGLYVGTATAVGG
jgi:hypothetical protein